MISLPALRLTFPGLRVFSRSRCPGRQIVILSGPGSLSAAVRLFNGPWPPGVRLRFRRRFSFGPLLGSLPPSPVRPGPAVWFILYLKEV